MSYQVLARRWRPQKFSEVVGQPHIVRALQNAVKEERIAHAYLLAGTRGIGKTTIARLFAKAINCESFSVENEPCGTCSSCVAMSEESSIDYLEIDGASNNSVDDIRSLVEKVQYPPAKSKYAVYVIDEVHMLSNAAFNALLKTLEEPPSYAVFIFATTEPEKLLKTVLSRCQRLDFKDASVDEITSHLTKVIQAEEIRLEDPSLVRQLALQAHGSFRDSLSLLDQIRVIAQDDYISEEIMLMSLGMLSQKLVWDMVDALLACNQKEVTSLFNEHVKGVDPKVFGTQLLESLFEVISRGSYEGDISEIYWIYEVLSKDLVWILESMLPRESLLLCLQKIALRDQLLAGKKKLRS